jgi:hypothetical protein
VRCRCQSSRDDELSCPKGLPVLGLNSPTLVGLGDMSDGYSKKDSIPDSSPPKFVARGKFLKVLGDMRCRKVVVVCLLFRKPAHWETRVLEHSERRLSHHGRVYSRGRLHAAATQLEIPSLTRVLLPRWLKYSILRI